MTENKGNKRKRETELTQYIAHPITLYSRSDCSGNIPLDWQLKLLKTIPNYHSKYPDVKARTPNVAVDNLCLFKRDGDGQICTILGFFDKKFQDKPLKGFVLSGGHMEVGSDVDLHQTAYKELEEEFTLAPEDIIKSIPVAVFDDAYRDVRNRYVTTVFAHWINGIPKPSDEHKVLMIIPIEKLKEVIVSGEKLPVKEGESYGFLHGHDGMLHQLLQNKNVLDLCKEIKDSK
jgi:8-oxo-dGTP pyrophosphatase MutT (NUDIX family)